MDQSKFQSLISVRFYFLLFSILLISCNSSNLDESHLNNSETIEIIPEDEMVDYGFNPEHPNAEQFTRMMNYYSEDFVKKNEVWKAWEHEDLIQERFAFETSESGILVYLIFCKHQNDCISICEANFENSEKLMFGVNGGVAFVVSGQNEEIIMDLVGYFAGEE